MIEEAMRLAHEAARTASVALAVLGSRLGLPEDGATALGADANLIAVVLAPRLDTAGTLAEIGRVVIARSIAVGQAASPRDAAPVFYDIAAYFAAGLAPTISPARLRATGLARALLACGEAAFLGQGFLAEAKSDFADRQSALAARSRITAHLDQASDRIAAGAGAEIHAILTRAARHATDFLVASAGELRPAVRVEATRSWPSTALAWSLYGDPARAPELVLRNRSGTPLFMPAVLDAVSPEAA